MKKFLMVAVFASFVVGCSDPAPDVTIDVQGTFSQSEADVITNAIDAFKQSCKPLFAEYWKDVISATATIEPQIIMTNDGRELKQPFAEKYGWRDTVHLIIAVADNPEKIPASFNAAGHTLFFRLGGGDQPGVSISKRPAAVVCGYDNAEATATADLLVSIPDMTGIDKL